MEFETWLESVPALLTRDPLWKMTVYRRALYAADLGWDDVTRLSRDSRTRAVADQLNRALGGISATIAEGYSRGSGRDRARFYEYALGSARETRDWYYKARHVLGEGVATQRMQLHTEIIRLLLTIIPEERTDRLCDDRAEYATEAELPAWPSQYGDQLQDAGLYGDPPR